MSSKLQLDIRHYNQWWRHLVNAYEVEAGMVFYRYLSAFGDASHDKTATQSHVGILGNEKADAAAKSASSLKRVHT